MEINLLGWRKNQNKSNKETNSGRGSRLNIATPHVATDKQASKTSAANTSNTETRNRKETKVSAPNRELKQAAGSETPHSDRAERHY